MTQGNHKLNNQITLHEVEVAAHNAALIANCSCPSRYSGTQWEQIWRVERSRVMAEMLGTNF